MKRKKLPVAYPLVDCYPATSGALSILQSFDFLDDWIYNNFIQLFEVKEKALDYFDFAVENNPYLVYSEVDYSLIRSLGIDLIDFIIQTLGNDWYIRLFINTAKVQLYNFDRRFYHDLFIYGYDKQSKVFYCADHFKEGKWSFEELPFAELAASYDINPADCEEDLLHTRYIQLIKPDFKLFRLKHDLLSEQDKKYLLKLNPARIKQSLQDYLHCVPTTGWYTRFPPADKELARSHRWGIDCYSVLCSHLDFVSAHHELDTFTGQSFYVAYNHKVMMLNRVKRLAAGKILAESDRLIPAGKALVNKAKIILNQFIKQMMTQQWDFDRLKEKIEALQSNEAEYLNRLFHALP